MVNTETTEEFVKELDLTEEEIETVKEMLPKLPQSIFSIIKIERTGKIKVLSDLSNIEESYKVLYYTEYQRIK